MNPVSSDQLALQRLYLWEKTAPDRIALTQPMGGGVMQDFTWAQVADEVRRMATHLKAQGWEPGSKVAILSKNCAWWLMSDLAIWMAGYVSVPLYPTLAPDTIAADPDAQRGAGLLRRQARRLGAHEARCARRPALHQLSAVAARRDQAATRAGTRSSPATSRLKGEVVRDADELATLIYTSGTTGMPKGVMHSFRQFRLGHWTPAPAHLA